jgi:hypothetical protein
MQQNSSPPNVLVQRIDDLIEPPCLDGCIIGDWQMQIVDLAVAVIYRVFAQRNYGRDPMRVRPDKRQLMHTVLQHPILPTLDAVLTENADHVPS